MAHKQFKSLYDSTHKHIENIATHILTNWVQHEKFSDEQMLEDYYNDEKMLENYYSDSSTDSTSHTTASWTSDASTAINLVTEQSWSC